jgi:hypothetical protein
LPLISPRLIARDHRDLSREIISNDRFSPPQKPCRTRCCQSLIDQAIEDHFDRQIELESTLLEQSKRGNTLRGLVEPSCSTTTPRTESRTQSKPRTGHRTRIHGMNREYQFKCHAGHPFPVTRPDRRVFQQSPPCALACAGEMRGLVTRSAFTSNISRLVP